MKDNVSPSGISIYNDQIYVTDSLSPTIYLSNGLDRESMEWNMIPLPNENIHPSGIDVHNGKIYIVDPAKNVLQISNDLNPGLNDWNISRTISKKYNS